MGKKMWRKTSRCLWEHLFSSSWRKLKYKIITEKLSSWIKCVRKDDFKEGMNCGASWKFNQGYNGEKEATGRMWRDVWCSQAHKLGEGISVFLTKTALLREREETFQYWRNERCPADRGSNNRPGVMMVSLVVKEGELRRAGRRSQEIFAVVLNLGWCRTSPKKN